MTRFAARRIAASFAAFASLLLAAFLAGCGGGGVSGPAVTTGALAISPASATVYSDVPVKFLVTGGTAPYFITSSNAAALPVPTGAYNYNELTLIPGTVGADTSVTLSATDAKNSTSVAATLNVRPRTISSVVTVTPTVACGTGLCAGGDAKVTAILTQNGAPLANRQVSFRVQSGDIRIIAPNSQPETLVQEAQVTTDSTGAATVRVRALVGALPQTALLLITDLSSGFNQQASVVVGASTTTASPLAANPSTITFQGVAAGKCADGVSADVIVTGGKPPYQVSQPASFIVDPVVVASSGGRFTVTSNGQCSSGTAIAVVDSAGSSVTVTVVNKLSDATVPPTAAFSVAPTAVSLSSCDDIANVVLIGGSGNYVASSGNGAVSAFATSGSGFITRSAGPAPGVSSVNVAFSDGKTSQNVAVTLTGAALGSCPATPPAPGAQLAISPASVTLNTCSDVANVSVSGGSGSYVESASTTALKIGGSGAFFSVSRTSSTGTVTDPQYVDVSDGSSTVRLTVHLGSTEATGTCTKPPANTLSTSPTAVTLSECTSSPNVVVSGGTGSYSAAASNTGIEALFTSNILTVRRKAGTPAISTSSPCPGGASPNQCVTVSDGFSTTTVGVNVTGAATGACP